MSDNTTDPTPDFIQDPATGKTYKREMILGCQITTPAGSLVLDRPMDEVAVMIAKICTRNFAGLAPDQMIFELPEGSRSIQEFYFVKLGSDNPNVGWLWFSIDALRVASVRPAQIQKLTEVGIHIAGTNN
jgi:hypothetical protein